MEKTIYIYSNSIDYRFKIIYAVAMVMVVAGHCGGGGLTIDFSGWFSYFDLHLALFVFSSGYFFKKSAVQKVRQYIMNKVKKLLIPLYIYNFIYAIVVLLLRKKNFLIGELPSINTILVMPINNGHQFQYNMGGWFVISLFLIEIFNIVLRKIFIKINIPEYVYFLVFLCLGTIGNYLAYKGHIQGWVLVLIRVLHLIPYYGFGVFYKQSLEKYERRIPTIYLFGIIFAIKLIFFLRGYNPTFTASWCNDFPSNPVMPIFIIFLGIIFWVRVVTIIEPILGKNKYINLIADNTYSIMINHFLFFMIIKTIFALLSKYTIYCQDFDWVKYKTEIFYYYIPHGLFQNEIIYLIAGIVGPIFVQKNINRFSVFVNNIVHNVIVLSLNNKKNEYQ